MQRMRWNAMTGPLLALAVVGALSCCADDPRPREDGSLADGSGDGGTGDGSAPDGVAGTEAGPKPSCSDGARNGDEQGIDCGGSCPNQDCCTNGARDPHLGELGVDCGGSCKPCFKGTVYYVANGGDDGKAGTSQAAAWKSVARVNAATFKPGDAILFRRGDRWYEPLMINHSGTSSAPITYGNYGTGALPALLGSKTLTQWTQTGTANIWVSVADTADPSRGAPHDGQKKGSGGYPGGVWFELPGGGVKWGNREKYITSAGDYSQLGAELDWGWYNNKIHVYSKVDPGTAYAAVQVSQRQYAAAMPDNKPRDHIVIDGLGMFYTQSKGFYSGYPASKATGLTIRNCHVGYVGIRDAASAYGLAVWHSDLLIKNNEIHDCGRRAVSYNVYGTRNVTFKNVVFDGNYFHHGHHTTGLDISQLGNDTFDTFIACNNLFEGDPTVDLTDPESFNSNHIYTDNDQGGVFKNFKFHNNIFTYNHGKGLTINGIDGVEVYNNTFYGVNPTLSNFQGQLYFSYQVSNAVVRNNIFYNDVKTSTNKYFICVKADSQHVAHIDLDYNLYFTTDPDALIASVVGGMSYKASAWKAYRSATGWDASSKVQVDPLFVAPTKGDVHLKQGSPAIQAGVKVPGVTTDFDGKPRSDPPSLGAYTYTP